jgi:hypothetical protein
VWNRGPNPSLSVVELGETIQGSRNKEKPVQKFNSSIRLTLAPAETKVRSDNRLAVIPPPGVVSRGENEGTCKAFVQATITPAPQTSVTKLIIKPLKMTTTPCFSG